MQIRADQIQEGGAPCGCGRSPTGFCTGLHALSDEEWDAMVFDEAFAKVEVSEAARAGLTELEIDVDGEIRRGIEQGLSKKEKKDES